MQNKLVTSKKQIRTPEDLFTESSIGSGEAYGLIDMKSTSPKLKKTTIMHENKAGYE